MRQIVALLRWRGLTGLLVPSLILLPTLILYVRFKSGSHFFLHTLMGWDVALTVLLAAAYYGQPQLWWDGFVPLTLALYALTPDFIYIAGPFHRGWMDVFLFHIALDEILPFALPVLAILPFALPVLAILWVVLLVGYVRFRQVRRVDRHDGMGLSAQAPELRR